MIQKERAETIQKAIQKDIAKRIENILMVRKMSQKDLAKKIGKSEAEVSRWLSGNHNFTIATLAKISEAIDENVVENHSAVLKEDTPDYGSDIDSLKERTYRKIQALADRDKVQMIYLYVSELSQEELAPVWRNYEVSPEIQALTLPEQDIPMDYDKLLENALQEKYL